MSRTALWVRMSIYYDAARAALGRAWSEGGKRRVAPLRRRGGGAGVRRRRSAPPARRTISEPGGKRGDGVYVYETEATAPLPLLVPPVRRDAVDAPRLHEPSRRGRRRAAGWSSRSSAARSRPRARRSASSGPATSRSASRTCSSGTLVDYESHGRKRLLPTFGSMPLVRIDEAAVRRWMRALTADTEAAGLSRKTVNNARTILTVALNEAVRQGLIPRNPCLGVPALPVERQELEYLRMHEIGPYLDACADYYRPLAELLIGSGLRISEALALRFGHLDLEHGVIRVYGQRDRQGEETKATKGKRFRSVQIGPSLVGVAPRAAHGAERRRRRLAVPLPAAEARPLLRADRAGPAEPQDGARLARGGAPGRRPARHAAPRAAAYRGGRLARDRAPADLRPAAARAPLDHDDRGALRAPGAVLRPGGRPADGGRDRGRDAARRSAGAVRREAAAEPPSSSLGAADGPAPARPRSALGRAAGSGGPMRLPSIQASSSRARKRTGPSGPPSRTHGIRPALAAS